MIKLHISNESQHLIGVLCMYLFEITHPYLGRNSRKTQEGEWPLNNGDTLETLKSFVSLIIQHLNEVLYLHSFKFIYPTAPWGEAWGEGSISFFCERNECLSQRKDILTSDNFEDLNISTLEWFNMVEDFVSFLIIPTVGIFQQSPSLTLAFGFVTISFSSYL